MGGYYLFTNSKCRDFRVEEASPSACSNVLIIDTTIIPTVTVLITTKDRKDELKDAIESSLTLIGDVEILVIDDGSTDGTYEFVTEHYPSVRIIRYEENLGLIEQRNNGIRLARADYVITIDDDAVFTSPDTALRVIEAFYADPQAGALAMPYIDVLYDDKKVLQVAPDARTHVMSAYVGTAHADRKDLFLQLGGYRGFYYRQGEEGDYCTRMLGRGYYVKIVDSPVIKHMESPRRVRSLNMYYEMRNNILYAWFNVPFVFLILHLLGTICVTLKKHIGLDCGFSSTKGIRDGLACAMTSQFKERSPVALNDYLAFRFLRKRGVVPLDQLTEKYELNYTKVDSINETT